MLGALPDFLMVGELNDLEESRGIPIGGDLFGGFERSGCGFGKSSAAGMIDEMLERVGASPALDDLEKLDADVWGHLIVLVAGKLGDLDVKIGSVSLGDEKSLIDGLAIVFGSEGGSCSQQDGGIVFVGGNGFRGAVFHLSEE